MWDDESEFDKDMDKSTFRDYEAACDRVKAFYKEQHGQYHAFVVRVTG
jgi:inositol oxygenase